MSIYVQEAGLLLIAIFFPVRVLLVTERILTPFRSKDTSVSSVVLKCLKKSSLKGKVCHFCTTSVTIIEQQKYCFQTGFPNTLPIA